jgi:hypothetical protein
MDDIFLCVYVDIICVSKQEKEKENNRPTLSPPHS